MPILEPLTKNKCIVEDSLNFTTEIVEQDSSNFMRSLDIYSLFTNIPLEKTIEICTSNLFKNSDMVWKKWFKDLLSLATKESYFIFNNILWKQIFGLRAMGSPLGPSLANAFLAQHGKNCLDSCPLEYGPSYYRRYVGDIFALFKVIQLLKTISKLFQFLSC